ncbi:MAG TPA: hypothetical protein VK763_20690 [Terriglobales bacterium]|nr:hypothetical protein [Terriglobales bacterium]
MFVVEYDAWGNWQSSPVVQQNIPSSTFGCYTVTWSTQMFSGFNSAFTASSSQYAVFALVCAAACPLSSTTPPIAGTLQFSSGTTPGSPAMFSSTVPTTPTTTYYGYTTAISTAPSINPYCALLNGTSKFMSPTYTCPTGIVLPASDQGLEIGNTTIHVNTNGGTLVHFPTTVPWGSKLVMSTPVEGGYAQMSFSAPNGIPVLPNIYGAIVPDLLFSHNTAGYQMSELVCLFDAGQAGVAQSAQLVDCSSLVTSPPFPSAGGPYDWDILNPAPPYIFQARQPSTYYYVGERVSDSNPAENVWVATTAGTSNLLGNLNVFPSGSCSVGGSASFVNEYGSTLAWTCIRSGKIWTIGTPYTVGTVLTENGMDYEVITAPSSNSCTPHGSACTTPTWNPNFGGCDEGTTGCSVPLLDGYQYMAISTSTQGPNLMVAPQFQVYGVTCPGLTQACAAPNSTYQPLYSSLQTDWSGCSAKSGTILDSSSATCPVAPPTGGSTNAATISSFTGLFQTGALPIVSITDLNPCPTGFSGCPSVSVGQYWASYTLGTPMGIIPLAIGENSINITATDHAIQINPPPAVGSACTSGGCPAPNAVGWYAGLSTTHSGLELPQIPDGVNAFCGTNGAPSNYVGNLPHGALCALGQPEIIVNPQLSQPYFPMFNASETIFNGGGISPLGSQNGNPLTGTALQGYGSRLESWNEECGRVSNAGEPYAIFYFSSNGQEESGPHQDKARDCMQGYAYFLGPGAQNSYATIGHVLGQAMDYTFGTVIQDVPGFRGFTNHSDSAFAQNTPYVSMFGVGVIDSPQAGAGGGGISAHIEDAESEVSFDSVQLRDALGVTINYDIGGAASRSVNNLIHADYYSRDFSITGATTSTSTACLLFYETLSATGCTTMSGLLSDVSEGLIAVGDVGGQASPDESLFSTGPLFPSQFYDGATYGTAKQAGVSSSGVLTWPGSPLTPDTGLSRGSADVVDVGNGMPGNVSGTLSAATAQLGSSGVGGITGQLNLVGNGGGTITVQPQASTTSYNFNLPTSPGTTGQPLLYGISGILPMTFGALNLAGGSSIVTGTLPAANVAGVSWSGLIAPTASLSFTHPVGDTTSMTWAAQSTNVTDWLWTEGADAGSPASNAFSFVDTTGNTRTGALLNVNTVGTSTALPLQVTAKGTANGVQMTNTGLLQPIGSGGITATGVPRSGLTAPTASLSFTHPVGDTTSMTWAAQSTNVTDWLWTEGADTGSPASNAFSFVDTTGNTRTGALLNVNTVGTSMALPIQITAQGTANGVDMTLGGLLQAIGSGGINATELNGNTYPASAGFIQGGLLCATSTSAMGASAAVPVAEVVFGGPSGNCPSVSANLKFSSPTLTIGVSGITTGILALASGTATGGVNLESATASSAFTATFPATTGTVSLMKAQACGTTSSCSATTESSPMVVYGSAPLVSGTPSTVTISGISPSFASSSSYVCTVSARSAPTGALFSVANVSSSSFTITGPNTVTTVINYIRVGT